LEEAVVTAAPTGSYVPAALPESGQVVEVRGSNGAVANVQTQGLSRSPAIEVTAQRSHVVDVRSLAEDRLSETLSAMWDLAVGHTVAPARGGCKLGLRSEVVVWEQQRDSQGHQ